MRKLLLCAALLVLMATPCFADECQHQWGDWETVSEPTCTEWGEVRRHCTICGETDGLLTPPNGHKYEAEYHTEPTCKSAGSVQAFCAVCGDMVNVTLQKSKTHTFIGMQPQIIEKATPFDIGVERTYCNCGAYWEDAEIPKIPSFIELYRDSLTIKKGKSKRQIVYMADGDKVKSWKIRNKKIVSIKHTKWDSIVMIKGKKKGRTTITVTLKTGWKAKFSVTVK